ncbi:MAG: PQQ-binding-like beta-propeller repeat protein, partial [Acidobacteriota bacterium]
MNKSQMKYVLFIACAFLLSLLAGIPSARADSPTLPTPRAPTGGQLTFLPLIERNINSWPMVGANLERTSWTREEVRGNLSVEWYHPIEPFIPSKVQLIAENDKIYVSTARGLYAFYSANGSLAWVFPTEMPLGHSPTIAAAGGKNVAFVGGEDHKMYALDAQTGQPLAGYTPFQAGAGFETNPLVINNTIYAGNRDGNFYALDAVTGALKWNYATNGPVLFSAAYRNGVVYFASNDSYAYALDASSGALVWKSAKFPGAGFQAFWPVIYTEKASGKVYVIF